MNKKILVLFLGLILLIEFICLVSSEETTNSSETWLNFDGVDDYVSIPYQNLSEITYTFWVKKNDITITQDIFSYMFGLIRMTPTQIQYWTNVDSEKKVLDYTPNENWTFVAVTQRGNKCSIYLDNSRGASYTDCDIIDTRNGTNQIGSFYGFNHVNGSIDDVRIFNKSLGFEEIKDIYYQERNGNLLTKGVPILGYHAIKDDLSAAETVSITNFNEQMKWLSDNNYHTITFKNFVEYTKGNFTLPENPVIISFDDGWASVYLNAKPIMESYNFIGCSNIITSLVGQEERMNWEHIQNLSNTGWEIASHSVTHDNFLGLSHPQRIKEFEDSKKAIEENLTGVSVTSFIYPYTSFNETANLEASEYYTFTGGWDNYIRYPEVILNYGYKNTNLYGEFERLGIDNQTTIEQFANALNQDNDLKMQLNFDEGNGTIAYDSSGNGNNGTIYGATWRDIIPPTATVTYSINTKTNQDVIATITPSEQIIGETSHTFTENGNYTFTFSDLAGNNGNATASVSWIDKIAPVIDHVEDKIVNTTDSSGAIVTYNLPNAIDGVDGNVIVNCSPISGSLFGLGNTIITCTAADLSGNTASSTFNINVVDKTAPIITLIGSNPQEILIGSNYTESKANAIDNVDGDISDKIVITGEVNASLVGTYNVTYDVNDSSGNNATQVIRTVKVIDTGIPVITLIGDSLITLEVGEIYNEQGANVSDNYDTGLNVTINSSAINTGLVGTYNVTYDVNDSSGNSAVQVIRTVNIIAKPSSSSGGHSSGGSWTSCETTWTCSDWTACTDGIQNRVCSYPITSCQPESNKPIESQSCINDNNTIEVIKPEEKQSQISIIGNFLTGAVTGVLENPISVRSGITLAVVLAILGTTITTVVIRKKRISKKK